MNHLGQLPALSPPMFTLRGWFRELLPGATLDPWASENFQDKEKDDTIPSMQAWAPRSSLVPTHRFGIFMKLSCPFPLCISFFGLNQKYTFYEFLTFSTYPFQWKLSAFLSFCGQHIHLGLWALKRYNFCSVPVNGSSTLASEPPSSAVILRPLVPLKCLREGTQLIQV